MLCFYHNSNSTTYLPSSAHSAIHPHPTLFSAKATFFASRFGHWRLQTINKKKSLIINKTSQTFAQVQHKLEWDSREIHLHSKSAPRNTSTESVTPFSPVKQTRLFGKWQDWKKNYIRHRRLRGHPACQFPRNSHWFVVNFHSPAPAVDLHSIKTFFKRFHNRFTHEKTLFLHRRRVHRNFHSVLIF